MLLSGLILAATSVVGGVSAADPYAETAPGWSLCLEPDDTAKTCAMIGTFTRTGDRRYRAHYRSYLSTTDLLADYDQDIEIIDGKDCQPISTASMQNLKLLRGERFLAGSELATAQAKLAKLYHGAGKLKSCSSLSGEANRLTLLMEAVGEPRPGYYVIIRSMQYPIKWIHADDGYRVRTWSA